MGPDRTNPFNQLETSLLADRLTWGTFDRLPAPRQHRFLSRALVAVRDRYRAAAAVDPARARAIISEARLHPPVSGPSAVSWDDLLDHATA